MNAPQDIRRKAAEIRIEQVDKTFGDLHAVRRVSLHIRKGDFYTLLGPSGCGKTTLLRMIAGFEIPDDGDIFIDDTRVNDLPPWQRDIGMVFQNFALWPHMSVFDNIAFGLKERKVPKTDLRDRVHAALKLVDLEGLGNRRPSQLSGGQQQRVALARTLVVEPRALLLDEPLSSLDAKLRIQMRNELVRLQQDLGITTVYVTHDQEEALALSTRVAVFSRGAVIQEGAPRDIYETPQSRTVADFVGASNFLPTTVVRTEGDNVHLTTPDIESLTLSWKPTLQTPPQSGASLLLQIRPESIHLSKRDTPNGIRARIRSATYLGTSLQYDVETVAGARLKVTLPNPRQIPVLPENTAVTLTFSPHDAVLLPTEPPSAP